jgi:hypothetical protein
LYKEGRPYVFLSCESFHPSPNPQINRSCVCKPPFPNARGMFVCRSIVKRNVLHAWRLFRKCRIIHRARIENPSVLNVNIVEEMA